MVFVLTNIKVLKDLSLKDFKKIIQNYLKISRDSITSNFTIKKQPTFIKKKLRSELEENLKLQVNNGNYEVIENNDETKILHHQWLSIMVAKQPLEIKKENLITELKLECGENKGIKNICSWSRKKVQKIK